MEEEKKSDNKLKTILIAFAVLLAFYIVSETISRISSNPAQISYEKRCAECHGIDGKGLKDMLPPLANSDWLENNQDILACIIKNGMKGEIIVNNKNYNIEMLGQDKIYDIEVTNIINYINTSWGNEIATKKSSKVTEELKNCKNSEQ